MGRDLSVLLIFVAVATTIAVLIFAFPVQLMVVATTAGVSHAATAGDPAPMATFWSASVQAESNKQYDEALKQVQAFQQAGGDPFMVSMRAGWLCYLKESYPMAEQYYANASKLQSAALNPLLGLLTVAQAMKDSRRIERAADAVLKVDAINYRANMALGAIYYANHEYRRAVFAYRRVLLNFPDDVDARSGVAWAQYYAGDTREALANFRTILSMYPDYQYAKQGFELVGGKAAPAAR